MTLGRTDFYNFFSTLYTFRYLIFFLFALNMDYIENETANYSASMAAGVSGLNDIRRNSRSSSSSNSSSSSTSSSSNSRHNSKKKKKAQRRRAKRRRDDRQILEKLSLEVGELKKSMMNYNNYNCGDNDVLSDVSGNLYHDGYTSQVPLPPNQAKCESVSETLQSYLNLIFDFETKLKEPAMPQTPSNYLVMLQEIQKLDNVCWSDIRYSETQKIYNHTPGFTELEINELVKEYDNIRHLAYTDKSYAALTFSILKQKESFINCLSNLVTWSQSENASLSNLNDKIKDLFLKGDYHKISNDILQIVCGHRAETIEMRRAGILKNVRDPLMRTTLNKIPPSNTHLFNSDQFTSVLEKFGGVKKTFWPSNKTASGNASRAKPGNNAYRYPIQGKPSFNLPSCGTSVPYQEPHVQPSRGYHSQWPAQGHSCNGYELYRQHDNNSNHIRGSSFRSRGSRSRPFQRGQKRPSSYSPNRGNKRQRQ
jgi:hypothetical protein